MTSTARPSSSTNTKTWLNDYLSALAIRDAQEQALKPSYDAYSKLADRTAAQLFTATTTTTSTIGAQAGNTSTGVLEGTPRTGGFTPPASLIGSNSTPPTLNAKSKPPPPTTSDDLTTLRADLTHAQLTKCHLTTQLSTLQTTHTALQSTHSHTLSQLTTLTTTNTLITRKLADREDELKRKKELLERVQDELLAAEMQVNIAEEERTRVEGENRELVGRLVGEKEGLVERMNREGGWG